jgi:hypothetical protein
MDIFIAKSSPRCTSYMATQNRASSSQILGLQSLKNLAVDKTKALRENAGFGKLWLLLTLITVKLHTNFQSGIWSEELTRET